MPTTKEVLGKTAFSLEPQKWNPILFKEEEATHLIFRYAAAPNTSNTTAMTVTVMAAMLPELKAFSTSCMIRKGVVVSDSQITLPGSVSWGDFSLGTGSVTWEVGV